MVAFNEEDVKSPISGPCFHGECWYKCPWCGEAFEYYDIVFERGLIKTENPKIYQHKECGKFINMG